MTEILSRTPQLLGKPSAAAAAAAASAAAHPQGSNDWLHLYYSQMPMLTSTWTGGHSSSHLGGMHDVDMRMFQYDNYAPPTPNFLQPAIAYPAEAHWPADVDMTTPPTASFAPDVSDAYYAASPPNGHLLRPPFKSEGRPGSPHSPSSSQSGLSPHQQPLATTAALHRGLQHDPRPTLSRALTAPEHHHHHRHSTLSESAGLKRSPADDPAADPDDDYAPHHPGAALDDPKLRGRKRQRIPHTAVERRYRENLNAHLDKLRQAVPALATRRAPGKNGAGSDVAVQEGVKPSKCEILNGAIEHIGALDKEVVGLKQEVKMLRAELFRRCSGGPGYAS